MIRWDVIGPYAVAFSTRRGGVSEGAYASLNLGRMTGDEPERVAENRRRVCAEIGADPQALALNRQAHGTVVNRARPGGRGEPGDALWSDEPGVPMAVLAADCVPIALARTAGLPALALAHAGWRGLLAGVVEAAVVALGGRPAAALGPAIGPCCYEVGSDVAEAFRARFGARGVGGRNVDLLGAAERALRRAGCHSVERVGVCTSCAPALFFSHRRDGGVTGRQGAIGFVTQPL